MMAAAIGFAVPVALEALTPTAPFRQHLAHSSAVAADGQRKKEG